MSGFRIGDTPLLRITVRDCETKAVVDLTGATFLDVRLRKPCSTKLVLAGAAPAPLTGVVEYQVLTTDFDEAGVWKGEAFVVLPSGQWTSTPFSFPVSAVI